MLSSDDVEVIGFDDCLFDFGDGGVKFFVEIEKLGDSNRSDFGCGYRWTRRGIPFGGTDAIYFVSDD